METLPYSKIETLSPLLILTEEDFIEFCDEDTKAEFIDGEVIVHSPASIKHGSIAAFLLSITHLFIDQHQLGRVWGENLQIRLRPGLRRIPDLVFISNENKAKITNTEIDGAPDLVVEIVSPESVERDWRDKYIEYEKAGIKEYWVIDPIYKKMSIYFLNEPGEYESQKPEQGVLKSNVLPGFWIKPEWLWQESLPNVIVIANELKIRI